MKHTKWSKILTTLIKSADQRIHWKARLPHGDRIEIAKVLGRKRNADGNFLGRAHKNPILDSRVFTVQFPDGDEKDYAYNVLAEQLFEQVDEEGN